MKHPLTTRVRDLVLAIKLWFWTWLLVSAAAVSAAFFWLSEGWGWRHYIFSSLLSLVGLGESSFLPLPASYSPDRYLSFFRVTWSEISRRWDQDFALLCQIPLLAAACLAITYLIIFSAKKD